MKTPVLDDLLEGLSLNGFNLDSVVERYREPHRSYHGIGHLEHILEACREITNFFDMPAWDRIKLHLAAFYHDAVYVVGDKMNEENSALLYADSGFPFPDEICAAIRGTDNHRNPQSFMAACLFDADLAGLGSTMTIYYRNRDKVFDEFFPNGAIGDAPELWAVGRCAFLDDRLSKPNIFHTAWGAELEPYARRNMLDELRGYGR